MSTFNQFNSISMKELKTLTGTFPDNSGSHFIYTIPANQYGLWVSSIGLSTSVNKWSILNSNLDLYSLPVFHGFIVGPGQSIYFSVGNNGPYVSQVTYNLQLLIFENS